jgi:hypothetical protein
MDAAIQQVAEQVVDDKVQAGEMFTAYDVTLEVRNRGHRAKHNGGIKELVHDLFGQGRMTPDYTRTLINLPGAPIQPWCYHPITSDPTLYAPKTAANPAAVASAVSSFYAQPNAVPDDDDSVPSTAPAGVISSVSPANGDGRKPDARGTVCVPAKSLRAAGLRPKDTAYVVPDPTGKFLVVGNVKPAGDHAEYTVDENNNVRITKATFQKYGLVANEYDFDDTGKTVTVKPA